MNGRTAMTDWLTALDGYLTPELLLNITRAVILLAVGLLVANLLSRLTRRLTADRLPQQRVRSPGASSTT